MKSPFPGMDPYLEPDWGDVHSRLATLGSAALNRRLPTGIRARVNESIAVTVDDPFDDEVVAYFPDVAVSPDPKRKSGNRSSTLVTLSEPIRLARRSDPETDRSIHIFSRNGGELVTAIEFLSPSHKIGKTGREEYQSKQCDYLDSSASLVEIDLIRGGRHVLAVPLLRFPSRFRTGYKVLVTRGWQRTSSEFYPDTIRTKLPTIAVPLRKSDPDVALDLQSLLESAYEDGGYDGIDYRARLEPALAPDDAAWTDELLKVAGKR